MILKTTYTGLAGKLLGVCLIAMLLVGVGCAHKANLDLLEDVNVLDAEYVQLDTANVYQRVTDLFNILTENKITTYNTKDLMQPYFQTDKELVDFIAIYASTFRSMYFRKEKLRNFKIKEIIIEENGVISLVRVKMSGYIYAFFPVTLDEVQKWQKSEGQWYMVPIVH